MPWSSAEAQRSFDVRECLSHHCMGNRQQAVVISVLFDRLCSLVATAPGHRSRGPGIDSRRYRIFWGVVCVKRGPFSLVRITEDLLDRAGSGFGLENRDSRGNPLRWPRNIYYPPKAALTSPVFSASLVVQFSCRLKAQNLFCLFVRFDNTIP
jgi:hypothetical protein